MPSLQNHNMTIQSDLSDKTALVLPVMCKGSSVILLASLGEHAAVGNLSAYSASKGAIDSSSISRSRSANAASVFYECAGIDSIRSSAASSSPAYASTVMALILSFPLLINSARNSASPSKDEIFSAISCTDMGSNRTPASPICSGSATTFDAQTGVPSRKASYTGMLMLSKSVGITTIVDRK
jgi:hypothetical protein